MVFYVPNNDVIYCFVEQILISKDRQSSLELTKNIDVAGRYGATRSTNKMNLTQEKADTSYENAQWCKK